MAWNHHNWIRRTPHDIDRVCSVCGTTEPRRTNRSPGRPRRSGRVSPAIAVDAGEPLAPCPKGPERHQITEGRGYDYCVLCGVVIRWPLRTSAPRPVVVGTPDFPMPKGAFTHIRGKPSVRSEKAVQRHKGKVALLFARDGEGCFYCGCALDALVTVLDHFIPRSRGGPDDLENRRASCVPCDKAKRDRMPWEFMPERFGAPEEASSCPEGV